MYELFVLFLSLMMLLGCTYTGPEEMRGRERQGKRERERQGERGRLR